MLVMLNLSLLTPGSKCMHGLASNSATSLPRVTTAINRRAHRDVDSSQDFYLKERETFIQQPIF